MKLIEKQRWGARVKKRYRSSNWDQRILASDCLTKRKIEPIKDLYRSWIQSVTQRMKLPHFCGQFTAFESSHI